jgi:hypothetical protein
MFLKGNKMTSKKDALDPASGLSVLKPHGFSLWSLSAIVLFAAAALLYPFYA